MGDENGTEPMSVVDAARQEFTQAVSWFKKRASATHYLMLEKTAKAYQLAQYEAERDRIAAEYRRERE